MTTFETFLAARAAKRSQIEAALADAGKGEFISGKALDRWVDSWETEERSFPRQSPTFSVETRSSFRTGLRPVPLHETTRSRVMPANAGIQNAMSLSGFELFIGSATLSRLHR